jgi:hypothetical protein
VSRWQKSHHNASDEEQAQDSDNGLIETAKRQVLDSEAKARSLGG